jgi:hypothetical protein
MRRNTIDCISDKREQAVVVYGHAVLHHGDASQFTDWYNGTYYATVGIVGTNGEYLPVIRFNNDDCDLRGTSHNRNHALISARSYATDYAKFLGLPVERWEFRACVKHKFKYPESRGDTRTNMLYSRNKKHFNTLILD